MITVSQGDVRAVRAELDCSLKDAHAKAQQRAALRIIEELRDGAPKEGLKLLDVLEYLVKR